MMAEPITGVQQQDYQVDLAVFQGPLDLLLYLIKKEEVDIYDIPIARITKQYLRYVEMMTNLNLEIAGEFILMAATLIRIKTRLLLPRDEDDPEEGDPREELIMALIEYKKYKEGGEILRERALIEERKYVPVNPVAHIEGRVELQPVSTLYDLLCAFKDVLSAKKTETFHQVNPPEISIEDRIKFVMLFLQNREHASFRELFADIPTKIAAVVTFIALLELARAHRIAIHQSKPYAELRVYRGDQFSAITSEIDIVDVTAINGNGDN